MFKSEDVKELVQYVHDNLPFEFTLKELGLQSKNFENDERIKREKYEEADEDVFLIANHVLGTKWIKEGEEGLLIEAYEDECEQPGGWEVDNLRICFNLTKAICINSTDKDGKETKFWYTKTLKQRELVLGYQGLLKFAENERKASTLIQKAIEEANADNLLEYLNKLEGGKFFWSSFGSYYDFHQTNVFQYLTELFSGRKIVFVKRDDYFYVFDTETNEKLYQFSEKFVQRETEFESFIEQSEKDGLKGFDFLTYLKANFKPAHYTDFTMKECTVDNGANMFELKTLNDDANLESISIVEDDETVTLVIVKKGSYRAMTQIRVLGESSRYRINKDTVKDRALNYCSRYHQLYRLFQFNFGEFQEEVMISNADFQKEIIRQYAEAFGIPEDNVSLCKKDNKRLTLDGKSQYGFICQRYIIDVIDSCELDKVANRVYVSIKDNRFGLGMLPMQAVNLSDNGLKKYIEELNIYPLTGMDTMIKELSDNYVWVKQERGGVYIGGGTIKHEEFFGLEVRKLKEAIFTRVTVGPEQFETTGMFQVPNADIRTTLIEPLADAIRNALKNKEKDLIRVAATAISHAFNELRSKVVQRDKLPF